MNMQGDQVTWSSALSCNSCPRWKLQEPHTLNPVYVLFCMISHYPHIASSV